MMMNPFELLRFVTLAECRKNIVDCNNYGYGLDVRRIKKGLPTKEKTLEQHKNSWDFWLDLFVYKTLRGEGFHSPLYLIKPKWEQEIMYDFWCAYFSYSYQGAKTNERPRYIEEVA